MALLTTVTTREGITCSNAYLIVETHKIKMHIEGVVIHVYCFADYNKRAEMIPFFYAKVTIPRSNENYSNFEEDYLKEVRGTDLSSAYEYLKSISDEDCGEYTINSALRGISFSSAVNA